MRTPSVDIGIETAMLCVVACEHRLVILRNKTELLRSEKASLTAQIESVKHSILDLKNKSD